MTRVITIAGTAITSTSDLDSIKVGGQAKQGDSALSEVIVYDDSNALFGTAESFIRKQWSVTENASGTAVYLARGRIAAFESHRGEDDSVQGTKVQYTWALEDANLELRGLDINDWERPAESGYARVTALGTAYLNGSPRATTNLNTTTYVPNSNTVDMPAKTYNNADAYEIITECAAAEDKKFFVTVDHELFYDLESSTSYAASLEISDGVGAAADPDGTNYFAPIWDLGSALSWEGQNYASRLRLGYNETSVLVTDTASETAHDLWVAHVADTETTDAAMATANASAELNYRKGGERTYALSLKIPAAQAYKIKYGQLIWIQSQAAVDTVDRVQRRIAELMWEPDGPYWYIARVNLDRPVRRRIRGSVSGGPSMAKPAPSTDPGTPAGATLIKFYDANDGGDAINWTGILPNQDIGAEGSSFCYYKGTSPDRAQDSWAATAGTIYRINGYVHLKAGATLSIVWRDDAAGQPGSVVGAHTIREDVMETGPVPLWTTFEYETTAPIGTTSASLARMAGSTAVFDRIRIFTVTAGTPPGSTDPYALDDPGTSPYWMRTDDGRLLRLLEQMDLVGFSWKTPVRVATTAAGTLATSFEEGDTVDGVALVTDDRILIKDQAAGAENGIYTVNPTGAPTRATDFELDVQALGAAAFVSEGTANGNKVFVCTTNDPITLGTTALVFAQVSSSVAADTIWDAKGDLVAGTAADTAAKVPVGANDTILMADSAQSTGLKWVAPATPSTQAFGDTAAEGTADTFTRGDHKHGMPASPAFVGAKATHTTTQSLTDATVTACALDTDVYDSDAFHDPVTNNSRFTVPAGKAGKYHLEGAVRIEGGASYVIAQLFWRLNGTTAIAGGSVIWLPDAAQSTMQIASCDVELAVGDYVELMAYQDSSGARNIGVSSLTTASVAMIGTYQAGAGGIPSGTAFPGSPANNDRFYRTDLHLDFFYDGTRWLTTTLYTDNLGITSGAIPISATTTTTRASLPLAGSMGVWLEDFWMSFFITVGGTALGASHKWVCTLDLRPAGTTMATVNIDSGADNVWRNSGAIAVDSVIATTEFAVQVTCTKTGTPGTLYPLPRISYRLIGT